MHLLKRTITGSERRTSVAARREQWSQHSLQTRQREDFTFSDSAGGRKIDMACCGGYYW